MVLSSRVNEMENLYRCKECNSLLMPTPSGSVCPEGHGRLMPRLPNGIARRNSFLVRGGREVIKCNDGHYYFSDEHPPTTKLKRVGKRTLGGIRVICGTTETYVVPCE